jgi:hypothetical protein
MTYRQHGVNKAPGTVKDAGGGANDVHLDRKLIKAWFQR